MLFAYINFSNDLLNLCRIEKESAEAMVSNFNFEFRNNDPDKRLRVQAIIQKTVSEAKKNILRKSFSKHLANSKLEHNLVQDSRKQQVINKKSVRDAFYA